MGRDLQAQRLKDAQLRRALLRLGVDDEADARCLNCGERRLEALEQHHIAGRYFTDETVVLCKNCHACVSDPSRDQQVPKDAIPEIRFVEGLAELLNERARTLRGKSCPLHSAEEINAAAR